MAPLFAEVEALLHVTPIADEDVNANNAALRRGAEALGWQSGRLSHNRDGCRRSGFCELGCAYDGKNNARKVVIPDAVRAGALVRTETHVFRVRTDRDRAVGVDARDRRTGEVVTVRARAVVLAASAVGSAALAIASDLNDPAHRHGAGLHLHPGAAVAGLFDRDIDGFRGIPQSWECTQWLRFDPGSDRRVWIVPAFAHPVGTAAMLPGVGPDWTSGMRQYRRMAVLTAMLHDVSTGRVDVEYGRPVLDYTLGASDRDQLARGLRACAEILLAAGAGTVVIPFAPPVRVRRASELNALRGDMLDPLALPLTAVHPMSSMRAGRDPARSVCDPRGQHHHVRGVYIADGGLFPTSLGSPPQISIYTSGLKVGRHVVEDLRRS
jgi:choline dehydrogenase-like flavoprotein